MVSVIAKSLMWIVAILVLLFFASTFYMGCASGAWDHIHSGHDPRLVGKWHGELRPMHRVDWNREEKIPFDQVSFELKPDGTVLVLDSMHFSRDSDGKYSLKRGPFIGATYQWGTDGDEVQFKYLATDYWPTPKFRFKVSPESDQVELTPSTNNRIPGSWKRLPSPARNEVGEG